MLLRSSILLTLLFALLSVTPVPAADQASPKGPGNPAVTAVAYHPSGKWLVAGFDRTAAIIDVASGKVIQSLTVDTGRISAFAFSRDGKLLAIASGTPSRTGTTELHQASDSSPPIFKLTKVISGHTDVIHSLDFSPDGKLLASGGYDRLVHLWSVADSARPKLTLKDHSDTVNAVAFHPSLPIIATGSADRSVKVWDVSEGKRLYTISDSTDWVYSVIWNPKGTHLAAAGVDRSIRVWQADAGSAKLIQSVFGHREPIVRLAYAADGTELFSHAQGRDIKRWDARTLKEKTVYPLQSDSILGFAVRPDGAQLAVGGFDGRCVLLNATDGAVQAAPLPVSKKVGAPTPTAAPTASGLAVTAVNDGQPSNAKDRPDPKEKNDPTSNAKDRIDPKAKIDPAPKAKAKEDPPVPKAKAKDAPQVPKAKAKEVAPVPKVVLPVVDKVTPSGAMRGATTIVTLEGKQLEQVVQVTGPPGFSIGKLEKSATRIQLELGTPKDAAIGAVELKLVTSAGGPVALRWIVDRFPLAVDTAGIDSARRAAAIKLPASIAGRIDRAGQADYFRFHGKAGQEIGVQVMAGSIGSALDPVLELTDGDGQLLVRGAENHLGFRLPKDGAYAVSVRDREYRGSADLTYRLHIGDIPVVTATLPRTAAPGSTTAVRLIGVNLPKSPMSVTVPAGAVLGSQVPIPFPAGETPLGQTSLRVAEFKPLIVANGATALSAVPGSVEGIISQENSTHLVTFPGKKEQPLLLEIHARRGGSPLDSVMAIVDEHDRPLVRHTLRCTARTFVTFRDHDSDKPGIRLEAWNDLAQNDWVYVGNELLQIEQLPLNPDADCNFTAVQGKRLGFLGTTTGHHPMGAPMYKVELHPPGRTFPPNGMPVFQLPWANDDGGPGYGKDSQIIFIPPTDGTYRIRIRDARGFHGDPYGYVLTVRTPRPSFRVTAGPMNPGLPKGGTAAINVTAERLEGYSGRIDLAIENLPPGFTAPKSFIEAGRYSTTLPLSVSETAATPDAKSPAIKIRGSAPAVPPGPGQTADLGLPKFIDAGDIVTTTNLRELTIRPGGEVRVMVKTDRRNGFKGRIPIDVKGLPHGVRVLDIGLNGILITERDTEREVVIYCEPWVEPLEHPFVILARREGKGTEHVAAGMTLKVVK